MAWIITANPRRQADNVARQRTQTGVCEPRSVTREG